MPLAMLAFGPLADMIRIEWLLIGSGLLLAVLALGLTMNKSLIQAGEPAQSDPVAGQDQPAEKRWPACPADQAECVI